MKVYYLQAEYAPGRHRVVKALYDDEVFKFDEATLSPFSAIVIDEIAPDNKALCLDLARTVNKVDAAGEGKYYVDTQGTLMEKAGWAEDIQEVF